MPESVAAYQSVEQGQKSPIEGIVINSATKDAFTQIIPQGQTPEEYVNRKLGFASGEGVTRSASKESLRVISPTGKRAFTALFFRPRLVGHQAFTSITAKGVGFGEQGVGGEGSSGLFVKSGAEKELQRSEYLASEGVRVSRVAAIANLNKDKLATWAREHGNAAVERMLSLLKPGESPSVILRFDNPRWSDLFAAKPKGPYSAQAMIRLGARSLHAEFDMANGPSMLKLKYDYPRAEQAQQAISEIIHGKNPLPDALREYLRLEAFFAGYNHRKLLEAGGRLYTARLPQDVLLGGAMFTDFESMDILRGSKPNPDKLLEQGRDFAESVAKMIIGRGYHALGLSAGEGQEQDIQNIFLQGFQAA